MTVFRGTMAHTLARKIVIGAALLAAAAILAGCSGFWNQVTSSTGSTTTTTTTTTLSSGPFFVLNQTVMQLAAYTISSGTLEQISGSPYTLFSTPNCFAVSPNGQFLYVGTTGGIYAYSIGINGALTEMNLNQAISSDTPLAMQVSPDGVWLVDAFINSTSGQVQFDAIPLNVSGTYTPGAIVPSATLQTISTTETVKQITISPKGDYLFAALGSGGAVAIPFTSGDPSPFGALAKNIPVATSNQAVLSIAVDPTERLFYVGETNADSAGTSGGLLAYNYSSLASTTPTQITGSPIASGGLSPSAILPEASGNYVYVANGQGETTPGSIDWFSITASGTTGSGTTASTATYSIAAGGSISTGIFPVGLAEDVEDHFVLAVSTGGTTTSGNPDLEAYTMSSGALTAAITSVTGTDPVGAWAIVALP